MFELCVVCALDRMTYDEYAIATSVTINAFGGATGVRRAPQAMSAFALANLANGRPKGRAKNRDKGQTSQSACRLVATNYLIRNPSAADAEIVSHVHKVMADRAMADRGLRAYEISTIKKKGTWALAPAQDRGSRRSETSSVGAVQLPLAEKLGPSLSFGLHWGPLNLLRAYSPCFRSIAKIDA